MFSNDVAPIARLITHAVVITAAPGINAPNDFPTVGGTLGGSLITMFFCN
jgi:hypothetical protein